MICLYAANETNFNSNGLCTLDDIMIDAKITEKLNADYAFEMNISLPDAPIKYGEILADDNIYSDDDIHSGDETDIQVLAKYELIEKGMIIKANEQLFRISEFRKEFNSYYIFARHIFYDLADNFLEDVRPTNQNGSGALNWILSNTLIPNNFVSLSDISTVSSAEYIRKNPVDAILGNNENSFINRWNGEIVRDNFTIKMLNHRGSDNGVLVEYKKNLTGFEADELMDGVITKIMPIGKDGLKLPEKYIDSPLISKYPTIKVQSIDFTNCDTIESLRAAAITYFTTTKCDIPRTNYKVNMMELSSTEEYKKYAILERVELGDTVRIRNLNLDVDITARAIVVVKIAVLIEGLLTWITNEIELGDFKDNLGVSTMNALYQLSKVIETNKSDLQKAIENATQLITGTLGGNLVIHQNANGKPYELLIMDKDDIMTAKEVWRWDLGGLGHSSNGYNGPYDTAITQDGAIVADFITTGILNADLIKTGTITSKNGKFIMDLENDTMTISGSSKWITSDGSGNYVGIDAGNLVQFIGSQKKKYYNLYTAGNAQMSNNSTYDIFLGDQFKNKTVAMILSLNGTIPPMGDNWMISNIYLRADVSSDGYAHIFCHISYSTIMYNSSPAYIYYNYTSGGDVTVDWIALA